jgi:hypothetical protein
VRYSAEPWVQKLEDSLNRMEARAPAGTYLTTSYSFVSGQEAVVVDGLTDLVMFLWQGVADIAAVESWGGGQLAREASWNRLLLEDASGDYIVLKAVVGEALAWWHEESSPNVVFAGRPLAGGRSACHRLVVVG